MLFSSGGSAVVFRVMVAGRRSALRCYLRSKPYLREIYGENYYAEELSVGAGKWCDVVVCDWVDGVLLGVAVSDALARGDRGFMRRLSVSFNNLAASMLCRHDWAHGDLSYCNIVVGEDDHMYLIDHDSNFVEALAGRESAELGSPIFQSPQRASCDFNADIDDFSIALIAVTLRTFSLDMTLVDRFSLRDGMLFDVMKLYDSDYDIVERVLDLLAYAGEFATYHICRMLVTRWSDFGVLSTMVYFDTVSGYSVDCEVEMFEDLGVWGYCEVESGDIVIPALFDEAFGFRGDEALVRVRRWWFYIDRSGSVVRYCGEWLDGNPAVSRF